MTASQSSSTFERKPIVFDEFFDLGLEDIASPFLTPQSRQWGTNLTLKTALFAALLLALAFAISFHSSTVAISSFLLLCVYFLAGIPSLIEAIEDICKLEINIDILMTVAAFSSVLIGSAMEGGLLLVLFALSGSIEDAVTAKAKGAIKSLHKLSPTKAYVIEPDGSLLQKSVKDLTVGTKILVKAGEIVPLDGVITEGISSVNLVHLTGENLPVLKQKGDEVPAGAKNQEGVLTMLISRPSHDSTLARIIQLVTEAQESKPKLQRWFDKLSKTYAMFVIISAAAFALTLPWVTSIPYLGFEGAIYRAVAFLIAASPCALIIAIPIAYLSALSVCARKGILLKGGITLDALASCRVIAFDKTGTLTHGKLTLDSLDTLTDFPQASDLDQALAVAAALEKNVIHPIAKAICDRAEQKKSPSVEISSFKSIPGLGVEATASLPQGQVDVYIGRPEYLVSKLPIPIHQSIQIEIEKIKQKGEIVTFLLIGSHLYFMRFLDELRPKMKETIQSLKERNLWRLLMLTGDHESSAKMIAKSLGIQEYYADLSPEDKLNHVSQIAQQEGLAMVGDGINDAPALARATVGICMGKVGSSAAIEAADVVLLQDNLEMLDWLMSKASQTQRVVKENVTLAAGAILIATLPALLGFVPLWLAVILHEGGTVLVGLNALRLLKQ